MPGREPVNVRGVVFDLDGTLVDNMPLHAEAFGLFMPRHGLPELTLEMRERLDGKRNSDIFPVLFGRPLAADEIEAFSDEKETLYRELSRGRLAPLRGLVRLLDTLEAHALPVAVATSAPAANVSHTLAELGLATRLTRVVRGDEVARGKPYPDVFFAAARLLGIAPEFCLAFEDAPMGVVAARAAGMICVGLTTSFTPEAFASHDAAPDFVASDYESFLRGPWAELTAGSPSPVG